MREQILLNNLSPVIAGIYGHRLHVTGNVEDTQFRTLITAGSALEIMIQITGGLLIAWRTSQTPKPISSGEKRHIVWTIFWACVDSGCLAMITELIAIIFLYRNPAVALVLVAVLAQVSVRLQLSYANVSTC